jgi:hypothetical protein
MSARRKLGLVLLCGILLFGFWFVEAGMIGYNNVPGTYVAHVGNGKKITLILKLDKTFTEEVFENGQTTNANGSWYLFPSDSQNRIHISKEFVSTRAKTTTTEKGVYGVVENRFSFISFYLETSAGTFKFRKNIFG